jgi:hypothetical protein
MILTGDGKGIARFVNQLTISSARMIVILGANVQ